MTLGQLKTAGRVLQELWADKPLTVRLSDGTKCIGFISQVHEKEKLVVVTDVADTPMPRIIIDLGAIIAVGPAT